MRGRLGARRSRRWLVPAGLAALLLVGWRLAPALTGARTDEWTEVRRGDLVLGVEVTGTLQAVNTSSLGPPQLRDYWEYKIATMAPEGEEVATGDPVLAFDASDLEQKLQRQEAEAEEAEKILHQIPEEFQGIGVRIEDDIAITEDNHENLTYMVPTEIDDIEALCAEPTWLTRQ